MTSPTVEGGVLGSASCDVCNGDVQLKLTKKGRVFYICGHCVLQVFSRGKKSSDLLMLKIKRPLKTVTEKNDGDAGSDQSEKGFFAAIFGDDE